MPNTALNFNYNLKTGSFRTIHYLGSKLRILDFIKKAIDEVDENKGGVCDLFSGSGSVSYHLSGERKVVSVDIQKYSNVLCSALLNPISNDLINSFSKKLIKSKKIDRNLQVFEEIIKLEDSLINGELSNDLELVSNFLENSSLYSACISIPKKGSPPLRKALASTIESLNRFNKNCFLSAKYFGGAYFSYKQACVLDAISELINEEPDECRNLLKASLLSTASDIVNTVGKQFAQPIRPRNKNGTPKTFLIKQLKKDRNLDVLEIYDKWLNKYSNIHDNGLGHQVLTMDFSDALDLVDDSITVVYADPPYTRDHYSRFYHGLETLSLMDYPKLSTTNIGGSNKISRGLYREERHQSDFCIRSKAPIAFELLFQKVSNKNKILLLSYSPYDKTKGAHPRVVELDFLERLARKYFQFVEIKTPGKFTHSKLNRTDLHLESEDVSEILLVCRNQ